MLLDTYLSAVTTIKNVCQFQHFKWEVDVFPFFRILLSSTKSIDFFFISEYSSIPDNCTDWNKCAGWNCHPELINVQARNNCAGRKIYSDLRNVWVGNFSILVEAYYIMIVVVFNTKILIIKKVK